MTFTEKMTEKARTMGKTLVLPESTEPRTLKAARIITDGKIAKMVILVGNTDAVAKAAVDAGVSLKGMTVIDPAVSANLEAYAAEYHELRKHKGVSLEDARMRITDPLLWGAMMVRMNDADAIVAGAEHATAKVLIAGFTIIKTAPGVKSASSCFVMDFPDKKMGKDGLFVFSDCATIPEPTVDQLAEITMASAVSCRNFLQTEPVVAMLSFSTKGSASHPLVDKVRDALNIVRDKAPDLIVDGDKAILAAEDEGRAHAPVSQHLDHQRRHPGIGGPDGHLLRLRRVAERAEKVEHGRHPELTTHRSRVAHRRVVTRGEEESEADLADHSDRSLGWQFEIETKGRQHVGRPRL